MSNNALKDYLISIGNFPLLSAEEELELGRRIKENNDVRARRRLIECNLKLVVHVAKSYKCNHLSLLDLISEGNTGLMTAVDKFDYTLGNRFSTCAVHWIKQAILKAINDKSKTIRLPAHIYAQLTKYKGVLQEFAAEGNSNPTTEEIAERMDMDIDKVIKLQRVKPDAVSLDLPLGDDSDDTLSDLQADPNDISPTDYADESVIHDLIQKYLDACTPRTRNIMKLRYGLGSPEDADIYREEHTLEEIGEIIGITRERVRQIIQKTQLDIKHTLESAGYNN